MVLDRVPCGIRKARIKHVKGIDQLHEVGRENATRFHAAYAERRLESEMAPLQQQIERVRTARLRLVVGLLVSVASFFSLGMIGPLALVLAISGAVLIWSAITTRCPFCGGFFFVALVRDPVMPRLHRFCTLTEAKPWCVRCGYEP